MNQQAEEQEIDLLELAQKLWAERKLIIKVCCIAAVVGIVAAFSIPKVYTTKVMLAPEVKGRTGGGLSSLAALAGVNMNLSSSSTNDALTVNLYPDIVSSAPFLTGLFDMRVADEKEGIDTTLYDYMLTGQKSPWWGSVITAPFKLIGWTVSLFKDKPEEADGDGKVNTFQLTQKEVEVMTALDNCIDVSVDNKTYLTTITVTMQNPVISAVVTDTVVARLQEYITDYRTMKARKDLAYSENLNEEARKEYYKAQQNYARYIDSNQNIILSSYRTESERLQNEMNLAYNVYNQTAQQVQVAKAKVMEITPVYAVVQPATVPLRPAKPNKKTIIIGFVFLAFVVTSAWILYGRDILSTFHKVASPAEAAEETAVKEQ
jgi:hypothetical protein